MTVRQLVTVSYVTVGTKTKNGKILRGKRKAEISGHWGTEEEALAEAKRWLTRDVGTWYDSYEITGVRLGL